MDEAISANANMRTRQSDINALHREENAMRADVTPVDTERNPLRDRELADAIASGDQDAFRTLMRRYNRLLYRTARSILKNERDAEDALQNAYLRIYRGIDRFRGEAGLSTWLVRIVINEALGSLRKRARSAHVVNLEASELDAAVEAEADIAFNQSERPDELLMRTDMQQLIQSKVDQLPLTYRSVFVLRALEELSVTETAEALQIPEATVRTRFFRARAQLRESMSADADGGASDTAFPFAGARCDGIDTRVMAAITADSLILESLA
jgi:RNA polymerase sigma-70 factor (ECF subfamily)